MAHNNSPDLLVVRKCGWAPCGEDFIPRMIRQKYCSWECAFKVKHQTALAWHKANPKTNKYPVDGICSVCGGKMLKNRKQHKYCTRPECQAVKERKSNNGYLRPKKAEEILQGGMPV
jgi:hypothetical protein